MSAEFRLRPLEECHAGPAPVLIRIETAAGHGAGKPVTKAIDETADMWAFLVEALGMSPKGLSTSSSKAAP